MKKITITAVGVMLGIFGFASNANALSIQNGCTTGSYVATNTLNYDVNGTDWLISYITYSYSPFNSTSTHNNLNERMYNSSGVLIYSFDSLDNFLRDGSSHVAHYFSTPLVFSQGSRFRLTNIFDVPNAADPQCTTTFQR